MIQEFAPAKINLTLRVLGRRPDDYHALESLVAFALDAGDHLTLTLAESISLTSDGPEAAAIDGPNLITETAEAMLAEWPTLKVGHFHLEKRLPVASGIGGGSADAAAAIRAIARASRIADPEMTFAKVAVRLGADVPVCIGATGHDPNAQAAYMTGIGERVWRPPSGTNLLPATGLAAVLVNPRVPVATAAVFKALAAPRLSNDPPPAMRLGPFATSGECILYIASHPNDLEAPALAIAPVIADVLSELRDLPSCRLARMSGSGATCFGLFDDMKGARQAAAQLLNAQPHWWVTATRLG
jgi:4-diphosphocytidyl-2-C-methyl-D-erythritol kinase